MQDVLATKVKDPDADLDFGFDWLAKTNAIAAGQPSSVTDKLTDWLASGETIQASTWTVDDGLTMGDEEIGTGVTKVWLSGGTAGAEYLVANRITTSKGRTDERTMLIKVAQR